MNNENNELKEINEIEIETEMRHLKKVKEIKNKAIYSTFIFATLFYISIFLMTLFFKGNLFYDFYKFTAPLEVQKLENILNFYDKYYIGEIDREEAFETMVKSIVVSSGDKYGWYVSQLENNSIVEKIETGNYTGIGITYKIEENYIEITDIVKDSPAGKSHLTAGDKITHINSKLVSNDVLMQFSEDISNNSLNNVTLRKENGENIVIDVGVVSLPKVEYKIVGETGFISIYTFVEDTSVLFKEAINYMKDNKVNKIVFDLRNNGGGSAEVVIDMLDYITSDSLIVKLESTTGDSKEYYSDSFNALDKDVQIKIIVNEFTASASELFTMCLQDVRNSKVIGKTTYGKSTIVSYFTYKDGSTLAMSTGNYYSLSGRYIEGVGITPDVILDNSVMLLPSEELNILGLLEK